MADEGTTQQLEAFSSLGHLRIVFLTIHIIGGLTGLPILVLTLLFSPLTTPRQPTLINFCVTWAINSIAYTLTALGGKVEDASSSLCFAQASMIFGAPPMSGVSTFLVVLQVWKTFRSPFAPPSSRRRRCSENTPLILMLCPPYVVYMIFLVSAIVLQLKYPDSIDPKNGLYCTVYGIPFRRWSVPISSVIFMALIIVFEVSILRRYFSGRKLIASSFPLATYATSHGLILRLTLFNAYLIITLSATVVFLSGQVEAWAYVAQASVPLAAFILFATQKNIVQSWYFWKIRESFRSGGSTSTVLEARRGNINLSRPNISFSTAEA